MHGKSALARRIIDTYCTCTYPSIQATILIFCFFQNAFLILHCPAPEKMRPKKSHKGSSFPPPIFLVDSLFFSCGSLDAQLTRIRFNSGDETHFFRTLSPPYVHPSLPPRVYPEAPPGSDWGEGGRRGAPLSTLSLFLPRGGAKRAFSRNRGGGPLYSVARYQNISIYKLTFKRDTVYVIWNVRFL